MTWKEFIDHKLDEKRGASEAGWHLINDYNTNKRGFYIRHVLGWVPVNTKPALVRGGAIADAQEAYYTFDFNTQAMIDTFHAIMRSREREYADPDQCEEDQEKWGEALVKWANDMAKFDQDLYEVVEVEKQHTCELSNGFKLTIRPDAVFREKESGNLIIREGKHTGYSISKMYDSVYLQDQATTYLWGLQKAYPQENVVGVMPDILYRRGKVIECSRPGLITRSARELAEFEIETIGLMMEMTQKVRSLDLYPPELLFPRNGKDDSYFGTDYEDLIRGSRSNLNGRVRPPDGYTYAPGRESGNKHKNPLEELVRQWETEVGDEDDVPA